MLKLLLVPQSVVTEIKLDSNTKQSEIKGVEVLILKKSLRQLRDFFFNNSFSFDLIYPLGEQNKTNNNKRFSYNRSVQILKTFLDLE